MDIYLPLLFLATTVTLPLEISTSGLCVVEKDDQNRPFSCTPCNIGKQYGHEVHVRNVATAYTGTAKVSISLRSGVSPRPVRLLLISNVHLQWLLDPSNLVDIDRVVTMSSDGLRSTLNYTRDKLLKPTHIHKDASIMTRDPSQVAILLLEKGLGEMTSYKADFSGRAAFDIIIGECDAVKTDIKPTDKELQCLPNSQCLIRASFNYNKDRTECTGESYITKYSSLYVGIVLCSSNKYKLYMSNLLAGPFLDMADRVPVSDYYGTDHCQVFGQNDETMSKTSHTFSTASGCTSGYGFYREHINQNFRFGKICGAVHNVDTYTGRESPSWYVCGNVLIPDNFDIIKASWQDTLMDSGPGTPTSASSTMPEVPTKLVSIIVPVVLGVVVTLVVIVLVIVFYRRRRQQLREPRSPRRDSRDLLQDDKIDKATRPPAELPAEAQQAAKESEEQYCYAGFNEPPRHCPKPPCNPGLKPVSELQKPQQPLVPNVYTTEPDNQRLQNNVPNNTVPKIQTMPDMLENSPNSQADTPGSLNVLKNPNIPSAPSTPMPQKKPSPPFVAKKPFVPKSPAIPRNIIVPASPKVYKGLISPKTHDVPETGIIVTAVQDMAPRGFLAELVTHLPTRADKTIVQQKDRTPYDNQYVGDDEEDEYLEIMYKS